MIGCPVFNISQNLVKISSYRNLFSPKSHLVLFLYFGFFLPCFAYFPQFSQFFVYDGAFSKCLGWVGCKYRGGKGPVLSLTIITVVVVMDFVQVCNCCIAIFLQCSWYQDISSRLENDDWWCGWVKTKCSATMLQVVIAPVCELLSLLLVMNQLSPYSE